MFGIFFSTLVVIALASLGGELIMRVRLTKIESPSEKLLWWRRGGDEVAATYQELFPRSRLPLFRRFVSWLFLACVLVTLVLILLPKLH
jgi:hypothetical protein